MAPYDSNIDRVKKGRISEKILTSVIFRSKVIIRYAVMLQ